MAVAHADVHPRIENQLSFREADSESGPRTHVYSPYLDDRLGIYSIFEELPKLGIDVDILITDGEETGESSAKEFSQNCQKNYNWIVEFDRRGEDVVLYKYKNEHMEKSLVEEAKFKKGKGASSDISHMKSLGVACFNVGIGFHDEHHPNCSADLAMFERQLTRFQEFYRINKSILFKNEAL